MSRMVDMMFASDAVADPTYTRTRHGPCPPGQRGSRLVVHSAVEPAAKNDLHMVAAIIDHLEFVVAE